jgi:hypothetical protein
MPSKSVRANGGNGFGGKSRSNGGHIGAWLCGVADVRRSDWYAAPFLHCEREIVGRELRLPNDLLFGTPPDKERPTIELAANLVDHLGDTHNYARQHLQLAGNGMKTRYDKLAICAGYQEGDRVWLYRPTRTKGKSARLQSSWEGPYKVITTIYDVVYRVQRTLDPGWR